MADFHERVAHVAGVVRPVLRDIAPEQFNAAVVARSRYEVYVVGDVDLGKMELAKLVVKGRHDPCVVLRAIPCVEAAAAIAVFDAILGRRKELL